MHVVDFFLGWIIAHAAHHICDGLQRHLAIELASLRGVLILRTYLAIIEKVFEVGHGLAGGATFQQLGEGIFIRWNYIKMVIT